MRARLRAVMLLASADLTALGALHGVAVRTLTGGLHGDVDRLSVDLAATGLFLCAGWLGVGLLAGLAASAPGAVGAAAERLARVVLPAVIRQVLAGSVGLGVLLTPVAAGAHAASAHDARPAVARTTAPSLSAPSLSAPSLSAQGPSGPGTPTPSPSLPPPTWPTSPSPTPPTSTPAPTTPVPSDTPAPTGTPTTTPSTPATPPPTTGPSAARTTTVRAGDSLWMLARHRLGTHADDAAVDSYWREIYRQNRGVIGDDPNLVRPGQHLTLPAPSAKESTR